MGGLGSTRWMFYSRKTTVEECYILSVNNYAKSTLAECVISDVPVWSSQTILATLARLVAKKLQAKLDTEPQHDHDRKPYGQRFRVSRTSCNYGGYRYWLHCPGCGRRVVKLYKPYYTSLYRCRSCHDLTYLSAQEAHQYDRLKSFGYLARNIDLIARAKLVDKKLERAHFGSKRWQRLVERHDQIMSKLQPLRHIPE